MPKLIINITETDYKWIKEHDDGVTSYPTTERLYKVVKKGVPLGEDDRPSGKWVIDEKTDYRIWFCHCSECGYDPQNDIGGTENWWLMRLPKFCSNCGAKMSSDEGE